MKTIWKYKLEATDKQEVELPKGHRLLTAQGIGNDIFLYVEVDPDEEETETIKVAVRATGVHYDEFEYIWRYLGTVQLYNGTLVFHVFTE